MRPLLIVGLSVFLGATSALATASMSYAKDPVKSTYKAKGYVPATQSVLAPVKDNPGKSAGVLGCATVIAFFPPAAVWCAVAVAGGATVDQVMDY